MREETLRPAEEEVGICVAANLPVVQAAHRRRQEASHPPSGHHSYHKIWVSVINKYGLEIRFSGLRRLSRGPLDVLGLSRGVLDAP